MKTKIKYLYKDQQVEIRDVKVEKNWFSAIYVNNKSILVGSKADCNKWLPDIKELVRSAIHIKNYDLEDFIDYNKKDWYSCNLANVMDAIKPTKKEVVPAPKKMSKKTKKILIGAAYLGVLGASITPLAVALNNKEKIVENIN